eukprot:Sspe_Gene.9600::Locus_3223_Transcript_2_2_Confidence_0.364_Length_3296::g.9600::m.9600
MAAHSFLSHLPALLLVLPLVHAVTSLGPGRREWRVEDPSRHGLRQEDLQETARVLQEASPERYCFIAVRHGVIVHEEYYSNSSNTSMEVDSAGKTVTAALIGAAIKQGLFDLDIPLVQYGVVPKANWSRAGVDYYPQVTARHLLGQASGVGVFPPGTVSTYDSNDYIQHLTHLLEEQVRRAGYSSSQEWATKNFASVLGIPDLYRWESGDYEESKEGGTIWAGGGQFMTCRGLARIGQLMLNKGWWRGSDGEPMQLVSEEYMRQMESPAFPDISGNYGFLTWLNSPAGPSMCCQPRWPDAALNAGFCPNSFQQKEDKIIPNAPAEISIAMGWLAKHLFVDHRRNMVVVTMGQTWGSSEVCDVAVSRRNYDEGISINNNYWAYASRVAAADDSLAKATIVPTTSDQALDLGKAIGGSFNLDASGCVALCIADDTCSAVTFKTSTEHPWKYFLQTMGWCTMWEKCATAGEAPATNGTYAMAVGYLKDCSAKQAAALEPELPPLSPPLPALPVPVAHGGSCWCTCAPDQGFGQCFNLPAGHAGECNLLSAKARDFCPSTGVAQACQGTNASESMCEDLLLPKHICTPSEKLSCKVTPGGFSQTTCTCTPVEWESCSWLAKPCSKDRYNDFGGSINEAWLQQQKENGRLWGGVNSHTLWSCSEEMQVKVLDAMQSVGAKVLRIVLRSTMDDNLCTGVSDLEPRTPGTFDDTVLERVDSLMLKTFERGIRLIVALHDRWSLGCLRNDAYTWKYSDLVKRTRNCTSNPSNTSAWYHSEEAVQDIQRRGEHVLKHVHPCLNRPWGELSDYILAFDPQHAAQWWSLPVNPQWTCTVAAHLKKHTAIPITTGGDASDIDELAKCPAISVLALHAFNPYLAATVSHELKLGVAKVRGAALRHGKRWMVEEFRARGADLVGQYWALSQAFEVSSGTPWVLSSFGLGADDSWVDGEEWGVINATFARTLQRVSEQRWDEVWSARPEHPGCWVGKKQGPSEDITPQAVVAMALAVLLVVLFAVSAVMRIHGKRTPPPVEDEEELVSARPFGDPGCAS